MNSGHECRWQAGELTYYQGISPPCRSRRGTPTRRRSSSPWSTACPQWSASWLRTGCHTHQGPLTWLIVRAASFPGINMVLPFFPELVWFCSNCWSCKFPHFGCFIGFGSVDGLYLIEVDRILRPGGYWILSCPPINWKMHWKGWERTEEYLNIEQKLIETVARSLCWKKIKEKGDIEIWRKPTNHIHCKKSRSLQDSKILPWTRPWCCLVIHLPRQHC